MVDEITSTTIPRRLGRYELIGYLASGGMAEILLARLRGPNDFERPVVIKRILPHLARQTSFRQMFLDEARMVAAIRHPNVVDIRELGNEAGELFMVLEYLEGESAAGLMRRLAARDEYLDFGLAAHIVAQACAGLHAAHQSVDPEGVAQNLVHRDVSPQNVFLTYDGQVKVLDFGIAKAKDCSTRTQTGQVKGKFEYMSPEQCLHRPLDRRADIFSLGVVLYELSTGRRLFHRPNQLLTMKAICEEPIVPPSLVAANYPPALERICLKALDRDPQCRFADAGLLRKALLAALPTLPSSGSNQEGAEDRLAALMTRIFQDRIDQKRQMIANAHDPAGVQWPDAEVDPLVEIPTATLPNAPDRTQAAVAASHVPSRSAWWPRIAAAAAVAALPIAAWLYVRAKPTPTHATSASASAPPSASVTIHIETIPDRAILLVEGASPQPTPADIHLARSDLPTPITLQADGFQPLHRQIVPDIDQRLLLSLVADAPSVPSAAASPPKPKPSYPPRSTPSASSTGFRRFD